MKRLILSFYYYSKVKEDVQLFDAWWQFIHAIGLFFVAMVFILLNVFLGLFQKSFSPVLVFVIFGVEYISSLIFNDFRDSKFYHYVINEYDSIKPINRKVLIVLQVVLLVVVICSIKANKLLSI